MIEPHGGELINRVTSSTRAEQLREELQEVTRIHLTPQQYKDVINIGTGRFSPLTGFLQRNDLLKVVHDATLENGTVWPLPITLDVTEKTASELTPGKKAKLCNPDGDPIGAIEVVEVYKINKSETARHVFGTDEERHPGVVNYMSKSEYLVGGPISLFEESRYNDFDLLPAESRVLFSHHGWDHVVGFQTRNAPHRAHEYIQKSALEHVDGLLVQPKLGVKKRGDYRDEAILGAYRVLLDEYYPQNRTALSVFPSRMRYAGPREALFDAIVRKNQGCTHFVIGRDHAGVGDFYESTAAHEIFEEIGDIGIEPVFFSYSFYCERCDEMASERVCPHRDEHRVHPSGTRIREAIRSGESPSEKLMRPEVVRYLHEHGNPFIDESGRMEELQ